ncbi:MAG: efflux RND transporter permease subunit [Deltaproteobacteria bacterium]|nr:efflux RND transporter permease subunit [Deltaproteobacteria bacterium]
MIRRIVAGAVNNWHVTLAGFLGIIAAGVIGYLELRRQEDAKVRPPYALIVTIFPGAGAERVESLVTRRLEEAVGAIGDIRWIQSTSRANVSIISVRLENGVDIDSHWQDLRERVASVRAELPEGVREPKIETKTFDDVGVILLAVTAPGQEWDDVERRLRDEARSLERRFESTAGVGRVEIQGDREEEVAAELDLEAMSTRRVTLERVLQALAARNVQIPPGSVEQGATSVVIEASGFFRSEHEIGETVVDVTAAGTPVRLREIGRVVRRWKDAEERVYRNGAPAMLLTIYPQDSADLVELADRLRGVIDERSAAAPPGLRLDIVTDQGERIEERVGSFVENLWQGMLIVVVISIFLLGVRNAILVSIAVPASCLGALFVMWATGIDIHQVSLGALVIALGMLVDNAIVVADNVVAHLRLGKDRVTAAIDGAAEVNMAILSSTLTTIAAFIPLMMMPGLAGEYVSTLPFVVSAALAWSYVFALLVTPMISARALGPKIGPVERAQQAIARGFRRASRVFLKGRWLVAAAAVAAVALSVAGMGRLGLQFFPKAEMPFFLVDVEGPDGSTVERTTQAVRVVEARLRREPIVAETTSSVGTAVPRFFYTHFARENDPSLAEILVQAKPGTSPDAIHETVERLNRELVDIPDTRVTGREIELGPPVGAPVVIRLIGDDVALLRSASRTLRTALLHDPAVTRAADDFGQETREVRAVVDDGRLSIAGLSHYHVAATIRAAVEGVAATAFDTHDDEIDVTVRAKPADRDDFSLLEDLYLDSPTAGKVPLRQVARLEPVFDVGRLHRRNLERTLSLKVWSDSLLAAELQQRVEKVLAGFQVPPGVRLELGGESEERDEAFANLGYAAIIAVAVILVILVAQFRSYRQALLILTTIPFSFVGAFLGLWLLDAPLGFMAMLGLISLSGVVVNNAILLLEFVNIGIRKGMSVDEAILEASAGRLRPILATSLTTVVGLLPLTFSGGGFWEPMGAVMIGGLLASTFLTLIVVPSLCRIFMGRGKRLTPAVAESNGP